LPSNGHRALALSWLLLVLLLLGHSVWLLQGQHLKIDTDVLAMLPQNQRDPALQQVTNRLSDAAARQVVVLIGGGDWAQTRRGADAFADTLQRSRLKLSLQYRADATQSAQWLDFFAPYRLQLLSRQQRRQLQSSTPQQLSDQALALLYQPMGMPRIGAWRDDPLNLYAAWLGERAQSSPVRVSDGRLALSAADRQYALLTLQQPGAAYAMADQQALMPLLQQARQAARAAGGQEVLIIGVPLYAAAAASQARTEMHTIGIGSLCGIILLTLLAFSAIRPRILVTLSIAIGLLCALSVCAVLFERLHLITLVFGASLVGVAENYGTNYFSNRLGHPASARWSILRQQAPSMWLAMLTTAVGYLLLALAPFPGLRQMAVFSVVGLLAAFITVQLWFPFLDRGALEFTPLARWIGSRRAAWPSAQRARPYAVVLLLLLLLGGALRLEINDDIRLLQNAPPELLATQQRVNTLLQLPDPARFYLVRGASPEQVLEREEHLKTRLDALRDAGQISGYQAISDWVPSSARQSADAALIQQVLHGPHGVLRQASARLGLSAAVAARAPYQTLTLPLWLASPQSQPLRFQWLGRFEGGYASVILIRGAQSQSALSALAAQDGASPGVQWVDKVVEISSILRHYRHIMAGVIALSALLVYAALWLRFGRDGWRALAPTLLAGLLTLALLALLGQAIQLFNVLALLLILGMGVDYGIFMLAQPGRALLRPFLSVSLAAVSTLLSFGLLALSATPALRAFGLTMLFGIALSWLLLPFFLPQEAKNPPC
jgi:predicted exporter